MVRGHNVNHVEGGLNPGWKYYQCTLQFRSGKATSIRLKDTVLLLLFAEQLQNQGP